MLWVKESKDIQKRCNDTLQLKTDTILDLRKKVNTRDMIVFDYPNYNKEITVLKKVYQIHKNK